MASIVVVGGGLAGLVCATRLRRAGHEVEVLEAAPSVGGRLRAVETEHGPLEAAVGEIGWGDANLRALVAGLGLEADDTSIVEAVVRLGHSLGLTVVAEGVETPLQLTRLRELKCDKAQGYLFGRPRPASLVDYERV